MSVKIQQCMMQCLLLTNLTIFTMPSSTPLIKIKVDDQLEDFSPVEPSDFDDDDDDDYAKDLVGSDDDDDDDDDLIDDDDDDDPE